MCLFQLCQCRRTNLRGSVGKRGGQQQKKDISTALIHESQILSVGELLVCFCLYRCSAVHLCLLPLITEHATKTHIYWQLDLDFNMAALKVIEQHVLI